MTLWPPLQFRPGCICSTPTSSKYSHKRFFPDQGKRSLQHLKASPGGGRGQGAEARAPHRRPTRCRGRQWPPEGARGPLKGWNPRAARMRSKGSGSAGPGKGQDGGREDRRQRTVADEVRHGASGALRVVPPRDAGAGCRAALPAVGAGGLHAGGLPPQGVLPAAREFPQQQAQRPQRVLCQSGLGLDILSPPAFHCPHQLPPDRQGWPGPAATEHPARGHSHLVPLHSPVLQHRALHGQLLPVADPGGGPGQAPEQAAVPPGRWLLVRL